MKIVRQGRTSHVGFGVVASKWKKAFPINCIILSIVFIPLLQVLLIGAERTNKKIDEAYDKTTALVTHVNERTVHLPNQGDGSAEGFAIVYACLPSAQNGKRHNIGTCHVPCHLSRPCFAWPGIF